MCTRLIVNISQVYTPLYLVDTLGLPKVSQRGGEGRGEGGGWVGGLHAICKAEWLYLYHVQETEIKHGKCTHPQQNSELRGEKSSELCMP